MNISNPFLAPWRLLTQVVLPNRCLACGAHQQAQQSHSLLCDACYAALPWSQHCCSQCGLGLDTDDTYCGHCLSDPPGFTESLALFRYQPPLNYLISAFKYDREFTAGMQLADLFCDHLAHSFREPSQRTKPDLLIPVPLHWRKRWTRGFNQSEFFAQKISKRLKIPYKTHLVKREAGGLTQKGLSRTERQKNLRGKFVVNAKHQQQLIDKHLVIIDDVVTTTATVRELSRVLLKAGAARVDVWALARTPERL